MLLIPKRGTTQSSSQKEKKRVTVYAYCLKRSAYERGLKKKEANSFQQDCANLQQYTRNTLTTSEKESDPLYEESRMESRSWHPIHFPGWFGLREKMFDPLSQSFDFNCG